MTNKNPLYTLYRLLLRTRTNVLTTILFIMGLLCFGLIPAILPWFGKSGHDILFSLAFICWGMTGIVYILRQEVDFGFIFLTGWLAIIIGIFIVAFSLVLALIPFIAGKNLLGNIV